MPKLWKYISKPEDEGPKIQDYLFAEAQDLVIAAPEEEPEPEQEEAPVEAVPDPETDPISYARVQSDLLLRDAERRAAEIMAQAERQAEELGAQVRARAEQDGYQTGLQQGIAEGIAQSLEETARAREAQAERVEADVAAFLDQAQRVLDRQLDENLGEMRDLALAVAEKIVCVSLKSSTEVIGKMIQTAVDKRRRREWVHIYVAESDARKLAQMPDSLMAALAALSDRVRIIPMADDEPGTCIIEMPDEIVDASATTQMNNIRSMLADMPLSGLEPVWRKRSEDRVPRNDPEGL